MSCFVLGQNRCAGVVFLYKLSGVKPYKEGPAEDQAIAGVRVFTWNKEDLGLSPMYVRLLQLKPIPCIADECQEPGGQSNSLSKSFETIILLLCQETDASSVLRGCGMQVGMLDLNDWQIYRLNSW